VNIPTGEFRALSERAAAADESVRALVKTVAWLADERPDLMRRVSRQLRPQLRVLEGGKL
jgi:hypothetical protein